MTSSSKPVDAAGGSKLAYSIRETLDAIGLSRASFYREVKAGRLEIKKVGKRTIVPADALRAWLAALPAA